MAEPSDTPDSAPRLAEELREAYPFLDVRWSRRLSRMYGTEARKILGEAKTEADLGQRFGCDLTEAEVRWLMTHEWAQTAEDVVWRRTKLGLRMTPDQIATLDAFMAQAAQSAAEEST